MLEIHMYQTEIWISKIKYICILAGKKRKKKPQTNVSCVTLEKCQSEAQITWYSHQMIPCLLVIKQKSQDASLDSGQNHVSRKQKNTVFCASSTR